MLSKVNASARLCAAFCVRFLACGVSDRLALAATLSLAFGAPAQAGTPQPPDAPPTPEYNLFDPTPDGDMRDMDTDRPNHANTPHTVDAGYVQIELGIGDFSRSWDATSSTAFTAGEINVRLGLLSNIELNVMVNAFETGPNGSGIGDTVVGGKFNVWGNSGSDRTWATALAVQPQIKLPTAGNTRGNGYVEAMVNIPFTVNLPDGYHLGLQLTPGAIRNDHNTATVSGLQEAVSVDRVLLANLDVYVEYFSANAPESRPQETIDVGFTLPVGKNVVVDSGAFFGLTRASVSFEYVAGLSVRF